MLRLIKKLSFWLPLLSLIVCVYNLTGYDDKNLLLALTSPPLLWFNHELTKLHYMMNSELLWQFVLYGIHFSFWLLVGLAIDWIISRIRAYL
ncbi:Uncharacterised protein [Paenibacillus macerans]|uniref:Uncharacterized protein n=1 Tax=Paenibacillus macerans TaxID=44252 RepID=A0A090YAL1_PAEMA|nr:hypothetical protein DJ90_2135 [Paenibacillus macerans]GBK64030.1 hypothetical protein PbDSM24746_40340 [Paenibacillus macerans]GBK70344.1 hypothetical protein PbJCM17693_40520 [Paenibacillus macerans]SUA83915.1 Uncharacterised protein [Paenibacillus macerans]